MTTEQDHRSDDPTRRTDLRTVEPHASAAEVYAALDCSYPGTGDDRRAANSTAIALHSYREPDKQSSGKTTDGRNRCGQSVPSTTTGINASPASSNAAGRRRTGFSGFESDDNARHNDDGGTMKTNRHHETDEQRGDQGADGRELRADGGHTVRADAGTDDLPRAQIREHIQEHPDATLSGILAAAGMHPNPTATREQAAFFADLVRGRLGLDPPARLAARTRRDNRRLCERRVYRNRGVDPAPLDGRTRRDVGLSGVSRRGDGPERRRAGCRVRPGRRRLMSVVARDRLAERIEQYVDRADDPTVPRALGALGLDPDVNSEERAVGEDILARRHGEGANVPGDAGDGEQGGPTA